MKVEVCGEPTVATDQYAPTPDNFLKLMKKLHPKTSLTWHSIVNLTGTSCPGTTETNVSKGSDYLNLTKATQGLSADICNPDFNEFIKTLTTLVIDEVDVNYMLPEGLTKSNGNVTNVFNATSGKALKFTVVNGNVVVDKTDISMDDKIELKWK